MNKTDRELVLLLVKSDEEAFRKLYIRYKDKLKYFCFTFLKSEEVAKDIVQEVFIRLWEIRNFIDPDLSFSSFMYTMTRNRILNYFRDMNVEEQVKKVLLQKSVVDNEISESNLIFADYKQMLISAIEQLPPRRKVIFNMSRVENKTHKEIALHLGISINTVQEHISESLRFIKLYFAKHADLILGINVLLLLS